MGIRLQNFCCQRVNKEDGKLAEEKMFTFLAFHFCKKKLLVRSIKSTKWITVVNGSINSGMGELTGLALTWLGSRQTCVIFATTSTSVKSFVVSNKAVTNVVRFFF